ncbi:MAG: hypothetical protein EOM67_12290 [Spirochaetia bacterium]|nr:hypothetical protein [Spirochaetia bacterium]
MERFNNLPEAEQEKLIKKLASGIVSLIKEGDRPTTITADPKDLEGLKNGLKNIRLGNPADDANYQQVIGMIVWKEGEDLFMQTLQGETEEKISIYLNSWAVREGLMNVASSESIPMELLGHKDVLIQIWSAWVALKIKEAADATNKNNTQIITPGLFR